MCATALEQCLPEHPIDNPLLKSSGTPARNFMRNGPLAIGLDSTLRGVRPVPDSLACASGWFLVSPRGECVDLAIGLHSTLRGVGPGS